MPNCVSLIPHTWSLWPKLGLTSGWVHHYWHKHCALQMSIRSSSFDVHLGMVEGNTDFTSHGKIAVGLLKERTYCRRMRYNQPRVFQLDGAIARETHTFGIAHKLRSVKLKIISCYGIQFQIRAPTYLCQLKGTWGSWPSLEFGVDASTRYYWDRAPVILTLRYVFGPLLVGSSVLLSPFKHLSTQITFFFLLHKIALLLPTSGKKRTTPASQK